MYCVNISHIPTRIVSVYLLYSECTVDFFFFYISAILWCIFHTWPNWMHFSKMDTTNDCNEMVICISVIWFAVHCLLALNPWLISYCYFFVVHLMGDILNGTWADGRPAHLMCKRKYLPIVWMCVCFFICYLLMRHPKEERALQNVAYSTYANTKHIHNILCAHCSLDSYHTVPSNCFDAIIFVVGLYLLYHTNRLKFHFSALV